MADKTEIQIKAAEKRLDAIERSIENLKRDSNSNDSGAQLKALSNKLDALTGRVDTLAASVKELGIQMVLKKDLKTATKLEADDWDREARAREIRYQAESQSKLDKKENEHKAFEKEQKAQLDKLISQQTLDARLMKLETLMDVRLKVLEARVR